MTTKKQRKRMEAAVASLRSYMSSYNNQAHYEDYTDQTFIDDVLYGLGVALDPEAHRFATGFDRFKAQLVKHLTADA